MKLQMNKIGDPSFSQQNAYDFYINQLNSEIQTMREFERKYRIAVDRNAKMQEELYRKIAEAEIYKQAEKSVDYSCLVRDNQEKLRQLNIEKLDLLDCMIASQSQINELKKQLQETQKPQPIKSDATLQTDELDNTLVKIQANPFAATKRMVSSNAETPIQRTEKILEQEPNKPKTESKILFDSPPTKSKADLENSSASKLVAYLKSKDKDIGQRIERYTERKEKQALDIASKKEINDPSLSINEDKNRNVQQMSERVLQSEVRERTTSSRPNKLKIFDEFAPNRMSHLRTDNIRYSQVRPSKENINIQNIFQKIDSEKQIDSFKALNELQTPKKLESSELILDNDMALKPINAYRERLAESNEQP